MKKSLLIILGLIFCATTLPSHAQKGKINFGVNAATASPLGDNSDVYKAAWGVDGSLDYYFNEHVDMGVESGLRRFSFKNKGLDDENLTTVPILLTLGMHTDVGNILDLYGELGGGAYIMSDSRVEDNSNYPGVSLRVGIAVEMSDKMFLDTGVDYTHIFSDGTDFNTFGVRFGILYTIN